MAPQSMAPPQRLERVDLRTTASAESGTTFVLPDRILPQHRLKKAH